MLGWVGDETTGLGQFFPEGGQAVGAVGGLFGHRWALRGMGPIRPRLWSAPLLEAQRLRLRPRAGSQAAGGSEGFAR